MIIAKNKDKIKEENQQIGNEANRQKHRRRNGQEFLMVGNQRNFTGVNRVFIRFKITF